MLANNERKLLRILNSYVTLHKRVPSIKELTIKTGRAPEVIIRTLKELTNKQSILWRQGRHDELKIIQAWEPHQLVKLPTKNEWEYY